MATTADLIERVRRHLLSGAPETLNQVAACDAVTTTVTLTRALPTTVAPGTLLSVGLETMYVWAVTDPGARTLEVQRGYGGSTAAAHALGDLVHISPPHTDFAILTALNEEIDSLTGAGLYARKTLALTASSTGEHTYNLASDVLDVYDVRYDADTAANQWPEVASWTWEPNMPASEFISNAMLRIDSHVPSGRTIHVRYKAALTHLATLADDAAVVTGLATSALDIPPVGAVWRLTAPAEVERNTTRRQGDSRRAEEVPQGAKMRSTAALQQIRAQRIREERGNLERRWPGRTR